MREQIRQTKGRWPAGIRGNSGKELGIGGGGGIWGSERVLVGREHERREWGERGMGECGRGVASRSARAPSVGGEARGKFREKRSKAVSEELSWLKAKEMRVGATERGAEQGRAGRGRSEVAIERGRVGQEIGKGEKRVTGLARKAWQWREAGEGDD